jgi:two-component system sensor histidine kinase PilS (NtrC family)
VTLYLISVLGAAIMGGARHTYAAAGACLVIHLVMSALESMGAVTPLGVTSVEPLTPRERLIQVTRTAAGIVGVTVLSSYLIVQLSRSASQVERLRALNDNIVRSLNSGLLTVDLDARLLYFNPSAGAILDLDARAVGQPIDTILPGFAMDDEPLEPRTELELTTRLGRRLNIGLSKAALLDGDGQRQGYVLNFQDLTRLHDLAQQVRRNERLAALGGLAASVAHEIRNPLAAISGSAELLTTAELGDEDQRLLKIIVRESTRLDKLISDILAFTRPRPPERRPCVLAELAIETCEAFRADHVAEGVEVAYEGSDEVSAHLDAAQIRQVLWNLLRNAAEANKDEDGAHVFVQVFGDEDDAFIVVQDDGPGISNEHLESIFDPFFTTKESGTGFGLAIVHRVVEDNGGSISVTSRPGEGAKFTIRFPAWTPTP